MKGTIRICALSLACPRFRRQTASVPLICKSFQPYHLRVEQKRASAWLPVQVLRAERVKNKTQTRCRDASRDFSAKVFARTALILLLLVAITGLSTLAKDAQYFPSTNPVRHASLSTKMRVAPARVVISGDELQPVARVVPPLPVARVTHLEQFETILVQQVSITVSMQHRSPPLSLS